MKILFAASEAAPFIKTGGLGDVAGALPAALKKKGAEICVVLPLYEAVKEKFESEEVRKEEFVKATEEAAVVAKEQKEEIGEAVVESPELANKAEEDRETAAKAATFAIVHDSPVPGKDTVIQDVVQYEVAKCVIPGLEGKVKTIDETPEGKKNAEEYLKQDEQINKATKELADVQKSVEQKLQ